MSAPVIPLRDKRLVAQAFSRAAPSYDSVAGLQRAVADQLLEWLVPEHPTGAPGRIVDLGSGTGYATPRLRQAWPDALLVNLDLAEGMLRFAREQAGIYHARPVCGDAEALPFADASIDLIYSSLAIQWCEQPQRLFTELQRVLRPGGRFLAATLGPQTLIELKQAWAAVDDDVHVNRFLPLSALCESAAGLILRRQLCQIRQLEYARLGELMHELKALGAHNVNPRRQQGLSGPARLRALTTAYEAQRLANGALPASYEVYYLEWVRES